MSGVKKRFLNLNISLIDNFSGRASDDALCSLVIRHKLLGTD
jgi:hypothetical protein